MLREVAVRKESGAKLPWTNRHADAMLAEQPRTSTTLEQNRKLVLNRENTKTFVRRIQTPEAVFWCPLRTFSK